ncbi:MAG: hypothetical protein CR997_12545 [Acidobacteria bacterium]|nr:MAG: hypothetical protein CR997_12545 [Acidobacteriota bacterium]
MKQKLILLFSKKNRSPGFRSLQLELGSVETDQFYLLLVERLVTEVFPLERDYEVCLATDYDTDFLEKWMGRHWPVISLADRSPNEYVSCILNAAPMKDADKLLILSAGTMSVDENQISSMFDSIDEKTILYQMGSDGYLASVGVHQSNLALFDNLDTLDEYMEDILTVRIEHYHLKVKKEEDLIIPGDLTQLAVFRNQLPDEHFVAKKIDDMILEKLEPDPSSNDLETHSRSIQIDLAQDEGE